MWDRDDRESEEVEVHPEGKPSEPGGDEPRTGPRLFSELGTGITTREAVIPAIVSLHREKTLDPVIAP